MKLTWFLGLLACSAVAGVAACGGGDDVEFPSGSTTTTGTGTMTTTGGGGNGTGGSGTGGSGTGGSGTGGSGTGGSMEVNDPDADGPMGITSIDGSYMVQATGDTVPVRAAFPTNGGPYPVVVVAHGFQLPPTQYDSYVDRLATHGFVAINANYPAGFTGVNHVEIGRNLAAALDWAAGEAQLAGKADVNNAGATGHSLGGKTALIAATLDARFRASITLDPVDTAGMFCSPTDCPDVSAAMPQGIPTGFLGETLDGTGIPQACAPTADNFLTFYGGAAAPSIAVTVNGANHMSFLDDVSSCGFTCGVCQQATAENAVVNALSRAYVVAFYQRYLKGNTGYDTYLTGAMAQQRYVDTGLVTIQSK